MHLNWAMKCGGLHTRARKECSDLYWEEKKEEFIEQGGEEVDFIAVRDTSCTAG